MAVRGAGPALFRRPGYSDPHSPVHPRMGRAEKNEPKYAGLRNKQEMDTTALRNLEEEERERREGRKKTQEEDDRGGLGLKHQLEPTWQRRRRERREERKGS